MTKGGRVMAEQDPTRATSPARESLPRPAPVGKPGKEQGSGETSIPLWSHLGGLRI